MLYGTRKRVLDLYRVNTSVMYTCLFIGSQVWFPLLQGFTLSELPCKKSTENNIIVPFTTQQNIFQLIMKLEDLLLALLALLTKFIVCVKDRSYNLRKGLLIVSPLSNKEMQFNVRCTHSDLCGRSLENVRFTFREIHLIYP